LRYSDFLGLQHLEDLETKCPGLGPFCPEHMFGIATSPAANREPRGRQECVIVVDKDADLYASMVKYGLVMDTGRRADMGYYKDTRVVEILFPFEEFGSPAPRKYS
jgi:hypothetical protein